MKITEQLPHLHRLLEDDTDVAAGDAAVQLVEDVVIWALECEAEAKSERAALENVESQQLAASGANESLETQLEELRKKLESTERRLAANRAELKSAKEELAKKEEALEKLTERMVGRSGGG